MKLSRNAAILLSAVILFAAAGELYPSLYATSITVGIYALLAVPLGLIYGCGGMLSLAQAAFAAVGGYTSALLFTRYGAPPSATLFPAIVIPALFAYLVSRPMLRLPEMSLALATLALGLLVEVVVSSSGEATGGYEGLTGIPPIPVVGNSRLGVFLLVWILVIICVYCYDAFRSSAAGRALIAIHVDRLLAQSVGVPVASHLSIMFAIAAGLSGLGGWIYTHYLGYIGPSSLTVHLSASLLFMVVIGGRKYSLGPVVGAVFFVLASDVLPGSEQAHGIFFGGLMIAVLLLVPEGLLSMFTSRSRPGSIRLKPHPKLKALRSEETR